MPELGFTAGIREAVEGNGSLSEALYSLVLFGSYVRGDYVPGFSDVDFLAVLRWPADEAMRELKAILEEATRSLPQAGGPALGAGGRGQGPYEQGSSL